MKAYRFTIEPDRTDNTRFWRIWRHRAVCRLGIQDCTCRAEWVADCALRAHAAAIVALESRVTVLRARHNAPQYHGETR